MKKELQSLCLNTKKKWSDFEVNDNFALVPIKIVPLDTNSTPQKDRDVEHPPETMGLQCYGSLEHGGNVLSFII
jgi:hypothetical protein